MRPVLRKVTGAAAFLILWEAASRSGLVDAQIVPPPSVVAVGLVRSFGDPTFLPGVISTVLSWLIAVALATAIGVTLGLLLGSLPRLRTASGMIVEFLRPLPGVALIPLVIALIGSDAQTKIVLATFVAVWPILLNTIYALGELDPQLIDVTRAYRVPRRRVALWVKLPATLPFILTGVRLSTSIALISLVSTEFLTGGTIGLGQYIYLEGSSAGRMDLVLAGTVFAGLLGLLANLGLSGLQRTLSPWAPKGSSA